MSSILTNFDPSNSTIAAIDPGNMVELDPGSADFKANGHRHMSEWAQRPPFFAVGKGQRPQLIVGRYEDVKQVFSDTATFASEMPRGPGWEQFNKVMDAQFVTQMDGSSMAAFAGFSSRRSHRGGSPSLKKASAR